VKVRFHEISGIQRAVSGIHRDINLPGAIAIVNLRCTSSGSVLSDSQQPKEGAARTEALNWLFWQMGSAPYLGGGFGHFYAYAPAKFQYAIDRFTMETKRQLDVLDRRLAETVYSRPAVQRGRMVNRMHGEPSEQLRERHDASDFDTKTQDKIQPAS